MLAERRLILRGEVAMVECSVDQKRLVYPPE
jgi:hypothetical protein